jgi:hypothetical protein
MVWREGVWVRENVYGVKKPSLQSPAETETVDREEEDKESGSVSVPPPWIGLHDLEIESVQKFDMVAPGPDSKLLGLGKRVRWVVFNSVRVPPPNLPLLPFSLFVLLSRSHCSPQYAYASGLSTHVRWMDVLFVFLRPWFLFSSSFVYFLIERC